jgi:hypothetical protein
VDEFRTIVAGLIQAEQRSTQNVTHPQFDLRYFTSSPTRRVASRSAGENPELCGFVTYRVADVCLPETEISAERPQAAPCCADQSKEIREGGRPHRDRIEGFVPPKCCLLS